MAIPLAVYKSLILGDDITTGPDYEITFREAEDVTTLAADRGAFNEVGAASVFRVVFDAVLVRGANGDIPGETFSAFEIRRQNFALALMAAISRGTSYTARGPLVWAADASTDWTTLDVTASASASPVVLDLKKTIGLTTGDYIYLANRTTGQWHYVQTTAVSGTDVTIPSMPWDGTFQTTIAVNPLWILPDCLPANLPTIETGPGTLGGSVELPFTFKAAATSPIQQP